MKKIVSLILAALFLSACATYTSMPFQVGQASLPCEAFEARPSILSTVAGAICFDQAGKPIGMIGGTGTSQAGLAAELIQAGSIVGAGAIIGQSYKAGLKGLGNAAKALVSPMPPVEP